MSLLSKLQRLDDDVKISPTMLRGIVVHICDPKWFPWLAKLGYQLVAIDGVPDWDAQEANIRAAHHAGLVVWTGPPSDLVSPTLMPRKVWPSSNEQTLEDWFKRIGSQADYIATTNEPNLWRFFKGKPVDLVPIYRHSRELQKAYAPDAMLIEPNVSTLGSSAQFDAKDLLHYLIKQQNFHKETWWDLTGIHIYKDNPREVADTASEYWGFLAKLNEVRMLAVGEFGFKSRPWWKLNTEGRQAKELIHTFAELSKKPMVFIANNYELADGVGRDGKEGAYGIARANHDLKKVVHALRKAFITASS